jgi:acetyl-CoA acetyltransferase
MAKKGGFARVAARIASKEGVSKDSADAILASSSRNASKAAKKANPALKRVKGK